jgi:hypothetical protein
MANIAVIGLGYVGLQQSIRALASAWAMQAVTITGITVRDIDDYVLDRGTWGSLPHHGVFCTTLQKGIFRGLEGEVLRNDHRGPLLEEIVGFDHRIGHLWPLSRTLESSHNLSLQYSEAFVWSLGNRDGRCRVGGLVGEKEPQRDCSGDGTLRAELNPDESSSACVLRRLGSFALGRGIWWGLSHYRGPLWKAIVGEKELQRDCRDDSASRAVLNTDLNGYRGQVLYKQEGVDACARSGL